MNIIRGAAQASFPSSAEPRSPQQVRVSRGVLAGASLALLAIPFALTLVLVQARWGPLLSVDADMRDGLHRYAVSHAGFVAAMRLISDSGSALAWQVLLVPIVCWLFWRRLPRLALFVAVTASGSSLLNTLVKNAVHRLRPVLSDPVARAQGLSFPSGHAQAATVGYGVLLVVFLPLLHGWWRRAAVTSAVMMVLAIGFSRVALGVHYLSDVVGGFILGAAWVAAMAAAFNVLGVYRGRPAKGGSASAAGPQSSGGQSVS